MFVRLLVIMPSMKLLHCMPTFLSYAQLVRHLSIFESTRHCLPWVEYDIPPPIIITNAFIRILISLETSIWDRAYQWRKKEQTRDFLNLNHVELCLGYV